MTLVSQSCDVLIVGAGLAGLSAAVTAQRAGLNVRLIEGSDAVGGRVRTDVRDGLRMDVGFQVLNPAYRSARTLLNYDSLGLRSFHPGVRLIDQHVERQFGNPLRDISYGVELMKNLRASGLGAVTDIARFGVYAGNASRDEAPAVFESDARAALRSAGLSDEFIESTIRPFLTGVFLEPDLVTSRRFLDFVLGYFIKGVPAVPAEGMQAIPEQLANFLHADSVSTNTWAHAIDGTSVHTDAGQIRGKALILATDQDTTAAWLGGTSRGWRSVTTWYHTTDMSRTQLNRGKAQLTIDAVAGRGPVINTVPISHTASTYTRPGEHLISSSVLGTDTSEDMHQHVKKHLDLLYGCDTREWQLAGVYAVHKALPVTNAPFIENTTSKVSDFVYVAGDHLRVPSINSAMESGVAAARAAIADLRAH